MQSKTKSQGTELPSIGLGLPTAINVIKTIPTDMSTGLIWTVSPPDCAMLIALTITGSVFMISVLPLRIPLTPSALEVPHPHFMCHCHNGAFMVNLRISTFLIIPRLAFVDFIDCP